MINKPGITTFYYTQQGEIINLSQVAQILPPGFRHCTFPVPDNFIRFEVVTGNLIDDEFESKEAAEEAFKRLKTHLDLSYDLLREGTTIKY